MSTTSTNPFGDAIALGRIIQSNSHIDYTAGIYTEHDVDNPPTPEDYEFGQPVLTTTPSEEAVDAAVGVIYNTRLVDPDATSSVPRLASGEVDETFRPSLVDERTTLVGIALLGTVTVGEPGTDTLPELVAVDQSLPQRTLQHQTTVHKCPDNVFRDFHIWDDDLQMAYYPRLTEIAGPLGAELVDTIISRLRTTTDEYAGLLDVIERKAQLRASQERGMLQ